MRAPAAHVVTRPGTITSMAGTCVKKVRFPTSWSTCFRTSAGPRHASRTHSRARQSARHPRCTPRWAAPIVLAKRRPVAPAAVAPMISRVSTRRCTASESAIDGAPVVVESTKCVAGFSFEDGSRGSVLTDCAGALCYDLADPGARPEAPIAHVSPSSRGPGRGPFKAKTRVRIPLGTPYQR